MSSYDYDLIVIGGGSGGLAAAYTAQSLDKRVAIIEKEMIGGESTWGGCIPTKALAHTAKTAWHFKNMAWAGLITDTNLRLDTSNVLPHIRSICQRIYTEQTPAKLEKDGINVFNGSPAFITANEITVGHKRLSAAHFIIATGSIANIPTIPGLDTIPFLTNRFFFQQPTLPHSILIIGAGASGIEFAQALNRLGISVTLIEQYDILQESEPEITRQIEMLLKEEGVNLYNHTQILQVEHKHNNISVIAKNTKGEFIIHTDKILLAAGRQPNIQNLNLQGIGIQADQKGIRVNHHLQTTISNIYAVGDVTGMYHYRHAAEYQAQIAVQNAWLPMRKKADYTMMPYIIFTDPEYAHVGLSEQQARAIWDDVKTFKIPFNKIDKALTDLAESGIAKLVFHGKELAGIDIFGSHAAELMQHLLTIKVHKIPLHKISDSIFAYPSFSDLIKVAGQNALKEELDGKWIFKTWKKLNT